MALDPKFNQATQLFLEMDMQQGLLISYILIFSYHDGGNCVSNF